jgi:hypothetical protein
MISTTGTYTLPLYTGNPSCDPDPENLVGEVTAYYDGVTGTLEVTYYMDADFSLNEVHTFVGCEMFPLGPNGKPTVAPGQYTYNASGLDYLQELTVTFNGISTPFYLIAHAMACETSSSLTYEESEVIPWDCPSYKASPVIIPPSTSDVNLNIYPNPFIEETSVEFTIGWDGQATVEIYNTMGVKVTTLFSGMAKAHEVNTRQFNAPSGYGQGVYFAVIRTEKGSVVKRIILTR